MTLYEAHVDIRNRGSFFPLGVQSEPAFRRSYAENGFWSKEEGLLVIVSPEDEIAGHIEFFKPVNYWDAFELSYQLYDDRFAGQGYTTEAVQLLVDYLFDAKKQHRLQLVIVPENGASRANRREVRFHPGRNGAGRVLQRRAQPGRADLLAAARRSATLACAVDDRF